MQFKILVMTFKAIHDIAPDYLCKLIRQRKSTGYSLRSSKKVMLEVPSGKILPTLDGRAFCYAAPKLWNNLPSEISSLDSLSNFKCHVKKYLFKQAFNVQQCICFVHFIIYHLLLFYFISNSFYLLVNFIHLQSFCLTYCKAHLIMCHGKLCYINFNYYYNYYKDFHESETIASILAAWMEFTGMDSIDSEFITLLCVF